MNEFIKLLISLSLSGTLLLMFIFLLKKFYKNRFSKCWQYYIWLLAALRFLLPFTPDVTIVGSLFDTVNTVITDGNTVNSNGMTVMEPEYTDLSDAPLIGNAGDAASEQPNGIYPYIFIGWLTVASMLLIRKIAIYQKFIRNVKATNTAVQDTDILNLLADCEEKQKIKKNVELCGNPFVTSPMMVGFIRPCIILPEKQTSKEELPYIFTHELIHYKRRDMYYKWFVQIVICIHWFNPFVYLLGREINKACELSCDEAVIYSLDDDAKKAYGDVLLSSVKPAGNYGKSLASVTLSEGAEQLKERLGAIMDFKKKSKMIGVATVLFTMAVCFGFAVTGAYADSGELGDSRNIAGTYERIWHSAEDTGLFWTERITLNEDMTYRLEAYVSGGMLAGQPGEFDSGTYSLVDGGIQIVSYDWEWASAMGAEIGKYSARFIVDGDYVISSKYLYGADIPSRRKNFEAECVLDLDTGSSAGITFHKDGTYEETVLAGENRNRSGTYERKGKFIHCTEEDGVTLKDFYIYKDFISDRIYHKVNE